MKPETLTDHKATLTIDDIRLDGSLTIPDNAGGLVLFAHGSGSSRFSPRNRHVAEVLNQAGLATLLFDLLSAAEEKIDQRSRVLRFDIGLLSERLTGAVDWAAGQENLRHLPIGLFGASTGAAAALNTAAARPQRVGAVVSRGGRPDLAADALSRVTCPTLLIVGGNDPQVIELNEQAAERLTAPHQLHIVTGATHLFEEPGKLDEVATLARDWFRRCLSGDEQ